MNRRDFLKVAAIAALAPVPALAHEPKPTEVEVEVEVEDPNCPRCGLGFDTDGDGDCAVCAHLPIIGDRTVEVMTPGFTPDQIDKFREQIDEALKDPDYFIVTPFPIEWDDVSDHGWVPKEFSELKVGDIFRLREEDGTIVDEGSEHEVAIVVEAPKLVRIGGGMTWGVWGARVDPCPPKRSS